MLPNLKAKIKFIENIFDFILKKLDKDNKKKILKSFRNHGK
jgi:hypothetical protein